MEICTGYPQRYMLLSGSKGLAWKYREVFGVWLGICGTFGQYFGWVGGDTGNGNNGVVGGDGCIWASDGGRLGISLAKAWAHNSLVWMGYAGAQSICWICAILDAIFSGCINATHRFFSWW